MRRISSLFGFGAFLACALWLLPVAATAQDKEKKDDEDKKKFETVRFETFDTVELKGSWWPSPRGKKAPVAMLLHKIGGKSNEEGWKDLAEDLQAAGFAVLSFDLRGHGASVSVGEQFWDLSKNPHNALVRRKAGTKLPTTVSVADFKQGYYPYLINDIAAAKRFIERRFNDAGECNLSNLVLIGAEDGATLGAVWLASETKRHRIIAVGVGGQKAERPESKDVIACVWLNMRGSLGTGPTATNVRELSKLLKESGNTKESKIPMAFIYGKLDVNGGSYALNLVKTIRPKYVPNNMAKMDDDELKGTVEYGVAGSKLVGSKLLVGGQETRERIVKKYLEGFILDEKKGLNEWDKRESEKLVYAWYFPGLQPIFTNKAGEKHMISIPLQPLGLGR